MSERGAKLRLKIITLHTTKTTPLFESACKIGIDQEGNHWVPFEVDYLEREDGECSICGAALARGWQCLHTDEEVCDSHIELA